MSVRQSMMLICHGSWFFTLLLVQYDVFLLKLLDLQDLSMLLLVLPADCLSASTRGIIGSRVICIASVSSLSTWIVS